MSFWITATVTVLAVTVLILLFIRPFTVYVTDSNRLYSALYREHFHWLREGVYRPSVQGV